MIDISDKRTGRTIPSEGRLRREMAGCKTYDDIKALCEAKDYSYWITERSPTDETLDLHIVCLIEYGYEAR